MRHNEWRRIAKKERRRRIRRELAQKIENVDLTSTEYKNWLQEQEMLEAFEYEQIEKSNYIENQKWIQAEKIAIEQWQKLQDIKKNMMQKQLELDAKLKLERELELKKRREEEERLKELEEEKRRKHEVFLNKMEQFLTGDCDEPPAELLMSHETKPNMELCPFFSKTACCRFGDQCSRNHQYPGISKVLLATNFYIHFGLDNTSGNEYDTDVMLEFEDSDTYRDFKEFFNDVISEFRKFGQITQFKVCNNFEKHLRGNVYVEYAEARGAAAAYRGLHARWYAGRQLALRFCNMPSWSNAICGLQLRRRCPKGRSCNFLHVFKNPGNMYNSINRPPPEITKTPSKHWRWSESPEPDIPKWRAPSSEKEDRRRRTKGREKRHRDRERRKTNGRTEPHKHRRGRSHSTVDDRK